MPMNTFFEKRRQTNAFLSRRRVVKTALETEMQPFPSGCGSASSYKIPAVSRRALHARFLWPRSKSRGTRDRRSKKDERPIDRTPKTIPIEVFCRCDYHLKSSVCRNSAVVKLSSQSRSFAPETRGRPRPRQLPVLQMLSVALFVLVGGQQLFVTFLRVQ